MRLVAFMIQHYFSLDYENFTAKLISAIALFKVIDGKDDNLERINYLKDNTHENIRVSVWKLDRAVNPDKGDFKSTTNKRRFIKNNYSDDEKLMSEHKVELDEDKMQHLLCEVINEVHTLVCNNIKGYKEEMKFDDIPDDDSPEIDLTFDEKKKE